MVLTQYDSWVLACASILLVIEVAVLLQPLISELRARGPRATLADRVASLQKLRLQHGCRKEETDLFSKCVTRKVALLLDENASRIFNILAHMSGVGLLLVVIELIYKRFGYPTAYTMPHHVMIFAFSLCMVLFLSLPALTKGRRLWFWYSVGNLIAVGFALSFPMWGQDGLSAEATRRFLFFTRLLMAICCPNVAIGAFWNGFYAVVSLYKYRVFTDTTANPMQVLVFEVGEAVGVVLLMHGTWHSIWMRAKYEVQELAWKGEGGAMSSLLSLMCDVVVELDVELRIVENVPRFAAMLALPAFKCTKGVQLQDFMPFAEDQEKFADQLRPQSAGGSASLCPGALHVRLRDSMGTAISVEVFYVEFVALDGGTRFFAGIREFPEQPVLELKSFSPYRGLRCASKVADVGKKGTSPTAERQALDAKPPGTGGAADPDCSDACSRSSASSRRSSETSSRSQPPFLQTTEMGMDISVVMTMSRWWVIPNDGEDCCCGFHASVQHLLAVAERLITYRCVTNFSHYGSIQCGHCGILSEGRWGSACEMCSRRITRRAPARSVMAL